MDTINVKININPVILEEQTNLSRCNCCDDIIYGKMFRVWLMPYSGIKRFKGIKTELLLCESCKDVVTPITVGG